MEQPTGAAFSAKSKPLAEDLNPLDDLHIPDFFVVCFGIFCECIIVYSLEEIVPFQILWILLTFR